MSGTAEEPRPVYMVGHKDFKRKNTIRVASEPDQYHFCLILTDQNNSQASLDSSSGEINVGDYDISATA